MRGKETVGMSVFTVQYNVDSRNVSFYCAIKRIILVVQVSLGENVSRNFSKFSLCNTTYHTGTASPS